MAFKLDRITAKAVEASIDIAAQREEEESEERFVSPGGNFDKVEDKASAGMSCIAVDANLIHSGPQPDHGASLLFHNAHAVPANVDVENITSTTNTGPEDTLKTVPLEFHDLDDAKGSEEDVKLTFGDGIDHPFRKREEPDLKEDSIAFVGDRLGIETDAVSYKSGYEGDAVRLAYVRQAHNGIVFSNAVANVAFNNANKVVAFESSFVNPTFITDDTPTISVEEATIIAEDELSGTFTGPAARLEYVAQKDGSAALAHVLQIRNEQESTWYEAFVDAHTGELISVVNFVAQAAYRVIPTTLHSPDDGFQLLVDPAIAAASPFGWHSSGDANSTNTSGNNALSFINLTTTTAQQSSSPLIFKYTHDPTAQPTVAVNQNVALVNAFYVVNMVHDITYLYGFTEAAFNFQINNFGHGGEGQDPVHVSVQDPKGANNANFGTPPDGQPGLMRMYIFTLTNPRLDGSLQNDIIIHELTHGITNRMTGGGTARCLQTTEAQGLGEGWSDAMADWMTQQVAAEVKDFVTGAYVLGNPAGVREFPYSTSSTVNPLRYSDVQTRVAPHAIGQVWANMLHNVYATLVGTNGWSPNARTDPTGTEGNVVFLHLFLDALALQPCNPSFVSARDAWIQADRNRYAGANVCTIWRGFASRGLGVGAVDNVDSTNIPSTC
ncbi:Fungalysin metallopeptidase-domain-containing protein [Pterulicium gracile]|uniref:Extracellular metalloproteinase n=1 Tax=Pterulicium gracile TaxID=1884261 RepID=A0A5C3PZN2_9AGAR|nr:Fungalysin metallopeptidase-domain-containing protein [Pterula gracilis]